MKAMDLEFDSRMRLSNGGSVDPRLTNVALLPYTNYTSTSLFD